MTNSLYECIVIGAGPAGLSASLFLARYRRRVLTFHHNSPRNLYSHGVHGFLGHHGILPTELLARGQNEVTTHGGHVLEACVTRVERTAQDHFKVHAATETFGEQCFEAENLILATGLRDSLPDCRGFREFYGRSVHHCPDCDAFEHSGQRIVVLGSGERVVGFALSLLTWTRQLTVLTDGKGDELTDQHRAQLSESSIPVQNLRLSGLEGDVASSQLERVRFADGTSLKCDALFFTLGTEPASDLHSQLGCKLDESCGLVWVDDRHQTSVPGVYAAGDLTPHSQLAVVAAAEGALAAVHLHSALVKRGLRPADFLEDDA
jgi:thioredoxin reductase